MLVNGNDLLKVALKEGYAIPAYNINSFEWIRFILEACEEDKSPVILSVSPKTINYFSNYQIVYNVVTSLMESLKITVPVVLHLDHAKTFEECKAAIDVGFTSVMIDASSLSLEDNISITNKVIEYAKDKMVNVEAGVGKIVDTDEDEKISYTDLQEVEEFVLRTNVDIIAPSIGNIHGFYNDNPKLDFELLGQICRLVKVPVALHGASFLDENKIKTAIFAGLARLILIPTCRRPGLSP